ncbi:MAG: hypothetical protein PHI12_07535 [Dehalococcoidales bacterium]|nr:hypothetical protein [Dehalococcoidales bacterium]
MEKKTNFEAEAGWIFTSHKARKTRPCKMGDGDIAVGEHCCAVTRAGGGLGWLKHPDYIHIRCRWKYLESKKETGG